MAWYTTKSGKHYNTDWNDKERQIAANKAEADHLNTADKLSNSTKDAITKYIEGRGNKFTDKQIEEIENASTIHEKPLYRVEDSSWMDVKAGKEIEFDKPLKSFTSSIDGVKNVVAEGDDAGLYESTIHIFKTVGEVQSLNVSRFSKYNPEEAEHLAGGVFVVESIKNGPVINGYKTKIIEISQLLD